MSTRNLTTTNQGNDTLLNNVSLEKILGLSDRMEAMLLKLETQDKNIELKKQVDDLHRLFFTEPEVKSKADQKAAIRASMYAPKKVKSTKK